MNTQRTQFKSYFGLPDNNYTFERQVLRGHLHKTRQRRKKSSTGVTSRSLPDTSRTVARFRYLAILSRSQHFACSLCLSKRGKSVMKPSHMRWSSHCRGILCTFPSACYGPCRTPGRPFHISIRGDTFLRETGRAAPHPTVRTAGWGAYALSRLVCRPPGVGTNERPVTDADLTAFDMMNEPHTGAIPR